MAWAIFYRDFSWARPHSVFMFRAGPAPVPQERPSDFIEAAVKAGAAEKVPSPTSEAKRVLKRAIKRAN
jgi:hypothetical protein